MTSAVDLFHSRINYLHKNAEIISRNIALADMPGKNRQIIKGFKDYIQNPKRAAVDTKSPIHREFEVLDLAKCELEHETLTSLFSKYLKLIKHVSSKNGY